MNGNNENIIMSETEAVDFARRTYDHLRAEGFSAEGAWAGALDNVEDTPCAAPHYYACSDAIDAYALKVDGYVVAGEGCADTNAMTTYKITSSAGLDMGTYQATDAEAAILAMHREAGYASAQAAAAAIGTTVEDLAAELTVEELAQ